MELAMDARPAAGPLDVDDVARLYAEHAERVRRLVRAATCAVDAVVEDACQIAWSRLIVHRARVVPGTAPAWVVRTAIHAALGLQRGSGRELPLESLDDDGAASAPDLLERLTEARAGLEAIGSLPERQQRLVWLQGVGFSYAEMALRTGESCRTVERQLLRAKRTLARRAA